jgi:hypothetical protein
MPRRRAIAASDQASRCASARTRAPVIPSARRAADGFACASVPDASNRKAASRIPSSTRATSVRWASARCHAASPVRSAGSVARRSASALAEAVGDCPAGAPVVKRSSAGARPPKSTRAITTSGSSPAPASTVPQPAVGEKSAAEPYHASLSAPSGT